MLKDDLILRSPVILTLGRENLFNGRFGAVMSRAGVGKTRFLVQIALVKLLSDEQILHISLSDHMEKINIRYNDGFCNLIDSIGYVDPRKAAQLWEEIQPRKTGLSYNESTFDPSKIRDYLSSFKNTDLNMPSVLIIDGLDFDSDIDAVLDPLAALCDEFGLFIWFSMQTHREEGLCEDGFPVQLEKRKHLFQKAVLLLPVETKIQAKVCKDGDKTNLSFLLDPSTLMPCPCR